jgi:hypothetical protein
MTLLSMGQAEGTWFPLPLKDRDPKDPVPELLIRRVPTGKLNELSYRHFGKKQRVLYKKGGAIQDHNAEQVVAFGLAKAAFALLDSKHAEVQADGESAPELSKLLGAQISPGQRVTLDGNWGRDGFAAYVLELVPGLAAFVNRSADSLAKIEREDEHELGEI